MPRMMPSAPSMHSLALPQRKVPFVLPRRQYSSAGKRQSHGASEELACTLPRRSITADAVLRDGGLPFRRSDSDESLASFPLSHHPDGRPCRCNSQPNSCMPGRCRIGVVPSSSPAAAPNPTSRQYETELNVDTPTSTPAENAFPPSLATARPKKGRSKSEPSQRPPPECDVLKAYREALYFHAKLREDYETTKRVFVLYRYGRLRSLIRNATVEQQLNQLRRATQCECSCGLLAATGCAGRARSVDGAVDGKMQELAEALRPTFNKFKACVLSAWGSVVPSGLATSSHTLRASSSSSSSSLSRPAPEHEWQRSRIVLLWQRLERMRREYLTHQRTALPLKRYRAMKNSLKHVLHAPMV